MFSVVLVTGQWDKTEECTSEYWNQRLQTLKLLFDTRLHFSSLPSTHRPSLALLSQWLQSRACGWTEYLWIKFYIWREIVCRCWPAEFGLCCTCSSDLVILVQTEVWSSLTKRSWLRREAFTLFYYIDRLKESRCIFLTSMPGDNFVLNRHYVRTIVSVIKTQLCLF